MEGYFDKYSPHLRRALELRQQGVYPEALIELGLACDEGDGLAWFAKGEAYRFGGWGLYEDEEKSNDCYKRSHQLGCEYGTAMMITNGLGSVIVDWDVLDPFSKYLIDCSWFDELELACKKGNVFAFPFYKDEYVVSACKIGDAEGCFAQYNFGPLNDINLVKIGAKQKHKNCMVELCSYYKKIGGKTEYKVAKWAIEVSRRTGFVDETFYNWNVSSGEAYIYGREFSMKKVSVEIFELYCVEIYEKVKHQAQCAVLLFLWAKLLTKDTRGIIARMVWKSRKTETDVWLK